MLRGLLILIWRQGLRRPSRWRFWRQLGLLLQRPAALGDALWLLLIEEHMLHYRELVQRQVRAQLASPLLQERARVPLAQDGAEPVTASR